jgi:ABC-type lipoprotein export system ATPase subunit
MRDVNVRRSRKPATEAARGVVVKLDQVIFGFGKGRPILMGATWTPDCSGGIALLRGRSGSGKTTVLHLISGLLQAREGKVVTLGLDLSRASERERRNLRASSIGHVYQDFRLLPELTASENVALPLWLRRMSPADARKPAHQSLRAVGLDWAVDRCPDQLSGGEQQRVALARALVTRPSLVLADEPTANLDDDSAGTVVGLLAQVAASGVSVIVASHDGRFEPVAHRRYELLDDGLIR